MPTLEQRLEALENEGRLFIAVPTAAWCLMVLAVLMACSPFLLLSVMTDRDLRRAFN